MPWRHINGWPSGLTAIHAIHLHNGTVVMWGFGHSGSNKTTRAWLWHIASGMFYELNSDIANVYCSGHAMMSDGAVLVAGGQDDRVPPPPGPPFNYGDGWGTIWAVALIPDDSAPSRARWLQRRAMDNQGAEPPPWDFARWYPTLTTAPDGSVLATSGTEFMTPPDEQTDRVYNKKVQLYDLTTDSWFTAPIEQQLPLYPAIFVLPSGLVFYAGRDITPTPPGDKTLVLRLSDYTWHVVTEGQSEGAIGEHNSACSFSPSRAARSTALPSRATVASGRTVVEMCLISYACVTHGFDQNQLYIPLAFSPSGSPDTYDVVAPPNANHAPPGYYMLFVTDNTGSYSQAAKVHLSA
jgi:hypothetical protein